MSNSIVYLVRDINSPFYFHHSTNIVLIKFGVMIILMILWNAFWSDLIKILKNSDDFNPVKKQKINKYFNKKNHGFVNWWIDVTNKIMGLWSSFFLWVPATFVAKWKLLVLPNMYLSYLNLKGEDSSCNISLPVSNFSKISVECCVHFCNCPWFSIHLGVLEEVWWYSNVGKGYCWLKK